MITLIGKKSWLRFVRTKKASNRTNIPIDNAIMTPEINKDLERWKKGKVAWNNWVKSNKEADVDFSHIDFGAHINGDEDISFRGFEFPNGDVSFIGSRFTTNKVDFSDTKFGTGKVSFEDSEFGYSPLETEKSATSTMGAFLFNEALFQGNVSFRGAKFGDGEVNFIGAVFFGKEVNFSEASFGAGTFYMSRTKFGNCKIDFKQSTWKGSCYFSPEDVSSCTEINFSSCIFEGELLLENFQTSAVIDLCHTKLNYPIDLNKIEIDYLKEKTWLIFNKATNQNASTCFRRLKKLAKEADDHQRALEFYAKEMQASYWHELKGPILLLYMSYGLFSSYGRSIVKPLTALIGTTLVYGLLYFNVDVASTNHVTNQAHDNIQCLERAIAFSVGHALPFYAGSRTTRADTADLLFGDTTLPDAIHWATMSQGLISGIFLFLIALALRNAFRS
ncbi:MAG: pentapeptide repeat-containing protein [Pseudomonadales bacterium]|nr:pentapeptide repeat-containing protein [Pseudomonadales bacterium]